jgi:hypothetical protein
MRHTERIKQDTMRKKQEAISLLETEFGLSSLWHGPYTVIDRVGAVTNRVQLIGSPKH